MITNDNPRN